MMRIIEENGGASWDFKINPQPTLEDLWRCIRLAEERNMRVLHLSGHGDERAGFIWNKDDAATGDSVIDVDTIAVEIGSVAGDQGPLESALLNACKTHAMGLKLRENGVPHVVCWITSVRDPIAREFSARFYFSLVRQAGGARDYRRAFFDAVGPMLGPAHASGAGSHVAPADVDVVQLLSVDGDSEPLWLKGSQTSPQAQPAASPQAVAGCPGSGMTQVAAFVTIGALAALFLSRRSRTEDNSEQLLDNAGDWIALFLITSALLARSVPGLPGFSSTLFFLRARTARRPPREHAAVC